MSDAATKSRKRSDPITKDLALESSAASGLLIAIGSDDDALNHDMIEGETSLLEALDRALDEIDDCEITETGCAEKISQISDRKSRATNRKNRVRAAIEQALVVAKIPSLKTPIATLTVKETPVQIHEVDEAKVPSKYFTPQPAKLDRAALLKDARAGTVAGVTLTNGGISLQIRRT